MSRDGKAGGYWTRGRLEEALGRLAGRWRARRPGPAQLSLSPGCAYGVRYAQAMEDLQKDVTELKGRLNGLLFLLAGAVALEVVIRIVK